MTGIDDIPADQRAVLRLLLDQGRSYGEIATSLKMAPAAVRDRAHDALSALGPQDTPLGRERRGQVADWLLGQQDDAETRATEDLLRSSAGARSWARAVSGSVEHLAADGLPALPGEDGADGRDDTGAAATTAEADTTTTSATGSRASADAAPASSLLVDDDADGDDAPRARRSRPGAGRGLERPSSRRGGVALLAALALLATLGAGVLIGRATKGDDEKKTATTAQSSNIAVLGQTNLKPPAGGPDKDAVGIAQFVERKAEGAGDPQKLLNVIAQGLPRAPKGSGYGVWLTKTGVDPVWLGYFQAVTSTGEVGAQSPLKVDPKSYERVILTRQRGQTPKTPGTVYLAGAVSLTSAKG